MNSKLLWAGVVAPLLFGAMQTSAYAACVGSANNLSCASLSDLQGYQASQTSDLVSAASDFFAASFKTELTLGTLLTSGYFEHDEFYGNQFTHNIGETLDATKISSSPSFIIVDNHYDRSFTVGSVASDKISAPSYYQYANSFFVAQLSNVVKSVTGDVVTYLGTLSLFQSINAEACSNLQCTGPGGFAFFQPPSVSSTITLYTNAPTVAVPGPEAGAGIGTLAMGGMAFWMKRRRSDKPLAA